MNEPLVSVIIPCYNGEHFISEAIESVLTQTYSNIEIIIIDDGSSDSTLEVARRYENTSSNDIKCLTHPANVNLGVSKTRRLGVDNAKGDYIAFLDADDVFLPNKVQIQVEALESNDDFILCHTAIEVKSDLETCPPFDKHFLISPTSYTYNLYDQDYFLKSNRICNSTVMIRSESLKDINFDSPQLFQYEDWLLWVLLANKGNFFFLSRSLIQYRYHDSSASNAIVKRPLMSLYSRLEFCLTLIGKIESQNLREIIANQIIDTIFDLLIAYSDKANFSQDYKLSHQLLLALFDDNVDKNKFNRIAESKIIHEAQKKISSLEQRISNLEQKISFMENSKLWRIRNKFIYFKNRFS